MLLGRIVLAGTVVAVVGCERPDDSHCWNLSRDGTCAQTRGPALPYCSPCTADNDGCVAELPSLAECPALADAGDASSSGAEGASSSSSSSSSSSTSTGPIPDDTGSDDGPAFVCGNGIREGQEGCDGDDLGGLTCDTLAPGSRGALACTPECTLDASGCEGFAMCGDGMLESPEQCEAEDLGGADCASVSAFDAGELKCSGCLYDTTGCCRDEGDACLDDAECCSRQCAGIVLLGIPLQQCR